MLVLLLGHALVYVVFQKLVAKAGMPIINKIPTIMKSNIDLASYLVEDTFGSVRDISKNVIAHYYVAGTTQVNIHFSLRGRVHI